MLRKFIISTLIASIGFAENTTVLVKHLWNDINYESTKNTAMAGATTATTKGYSALFINPAGLSSNYAVGIYAKASNVTHSNNSGSGEEDDQVVTEEVAFGDGMAIGLFYKYLVAEVFSDRYSAVGFGYGIDTRFGLFSLGLSQYKDDTLDTNYRKYGKGDFKTYGFQWQKSFIGIDGFRAWYVGLSVKEQGVNIDHKDTLLVTTSPLIKRLGVGYETNIGTHTMLFTFDRQEQSFLDISDTLLINAVGWKWIMGDGFALSAGMEKGTYQNSLFKDRTNIGLGMEFVLWQMNFGLSANIKEVNNEEGLYSKDEVLHIDFAIAF